MNVEVRLFATLREYMPPGGNRTAAEVVMPAGATIRDLLAELRIPEQLAALILVNGRHQADKTHPLSEGSVVSVFPAIAGG
jgi:molybdopterin converting factor small subunit